jgi:hypothetical protein
VLEKLFKNSDNWKNFRRPSRSELVKAMGEPVRIPTSADTIQMQPRVAPSRRSAWMAGGVVLLAGMAVAWQGGWLTAGQSGSAAAPQAAEPAKAGIPPAAPEQMKLAEWVVAHEGFVNVKTDSSPEERMGEGFDILRTTDLPQGPFTIWRVSLSTVPLKTEEDLKELALLAQEAGTVSNLCLRGMEVPVAALVHLTSIPKLKNLDLSSTSLVTDDAMEHLVACKSLRALRVSKNRMSDADAMMEKLGLMLPQCKILSTD